MSNERDFFQLSAQIEDLVGRVESIADPAVRANVTVLLQSLLELHSKGLACICDLLLEEGDAGQRILDSLARDELVGGLLLLYGLHPDSFDARLEKAVEKIREQLHPSGSSIELLGIEDRLVRVRVVKEGHACGTTAAGIDAMIKDFIYAAAPEVTGIEIQRARAAKAGNSGGLVQLQVNAAAGPHNSVNG